jgi:hypothetical protein
MGNSGFHHQGGILLIDLYVSGLKYLIPYFLEPSSFTGPMMPDGTGSQKAALKLL